MAVRKKTLVLAILVVAIAIAGLVVYFYQGIPSHQVSRIVWQRSGGFAGLNEKLTLEANGSVYYQSNFFGSSNITLTEDKVNNILSLLDEAKFFTLKDKYQAKPDAVDYFSYRLAATDTRGETKTVEWVDAWASETAIPGSLLEIQRSIEQIIDIVHQTQGVTEEYNAIQTATTFVVHEATFAFDGIPETLKVVDKNILKSNPPQYAITLSFESRHAGYGNREGQNLPQVITPHTAVVTVVNNMVVSGILDGQWDMIKQEFIQD